MEDHTKGILAIAAAGLMMGFVPFLVRQLLALSSVQVSFLREIIAVVFLLPYIVWKGGLTLKNIKFAKSKAGAAFIVSTIGTMIFYMWSVRLISPAISALLLYMAPFYVALLAPIIIKEKPVKNRAICVLLSLVGLVLVLSPGGKMNLLGIIIGALSGLTYTVTFLTLRVLRMRNYGAAELTFYNGFIMCLVLLPLALINFPTLSTIEWWWILLLGIGPTAIGFALYNYGAGHCTAQETSLLALIEPISVSIVSWFLLSETLNAMQI
jgi:DME family drug/metabolite transporter